MPPRRRAARLTTVGGTGAPLPVQGQFPKPKDPPSKWGRDAISRFWNLSEYMRKSREADEREINQAQPLRARIAALKAELDGAERAQEDIEADSDRLSQDLRDCKQLHGMR